MVAWMAAWRDESLDTLKGYELADKYDYKTVLRSEIVWEPRLAVQ